MAKIRISYELECGKAIFLHLTYLINVYKEELWVKIVVFPQKVSIFATPKMQMRIGNKFVEPANESSLTSSDRAVSLAKNS